MRYEFSRRDDGFIDINGIEYPPGEFLLVRGENGIVAAGCRIVMMERESGWSLLVEPVADRTPMVGESLIGVRGVDGEMVDIAIDRLPDDIILEWLG